MFSTLIFKRGLLLCFFSMMAVFSFADELGFTIKEWDYKAEVSSTNVWKVTERMLVNFYERRHGIYRFLPQKYSYFHNIGYKEGEFNWREFHYHLGVDDIDVQGWDFTTDEATDNQSSIVIRVGSESEYLIDDQEFVFTYTITYPDDRFTRYDYIFHSVLGADCNVPIDKFTYCVRFQDGIPAESRDKLNINSGAWGTVGNNLGIQAEVSESSISGTAYNIQPQNAITLQMYLPEGYFHDTWRVNPLTCIILALLATLCAAKLIVTLLLNPPQKPVPVVEFFPPDGISSAEVGTIIDETVDLEDITSMIPWFAHQGYIKIREIAHKGKSDDIELTVINELSGSAPTYQKCIWDIFFRHNNKVLMSNIGNQYDHVEAAKSALRSHFSGIRSLTEMRSGIVWLITNWVLVLLSIGTCSAVEVFDLGMFLAACVGFLAPVLIVLAVRITRVKYLYQLPIKNFLIDLFCLFWLGLSAYGYFTVQVDIDCMMPMWAAIPMLASSYLLAFMTNRMMVNTEYRQSLAGRLLGFREFIDKAEKDRLEKLVDEYPDYFYQVLPYAIVFGLSDKWSNHFKNIDIQQPEWFHGVGNTFTSSFYNSRVNKMVASNLKKQIVVPSHDTSSGSSWHSTGSSGGFSGGFSGGGGGGGGVGSW